jgi:hypothetical protein
MKGAPPLAPAYCPAQVRVGAGERAYSDLEVVKELRLLDNAARKLERVAPRATGKPRSAPSVLQRHAMPSAACRATCQQGGAACLARPRARARMDAAVRG